MNSTIDKAQNMNEICACEYVNMITDLEKTYEYIDKLSELRDSLEDKKIILKRGMSSERNVIDAEILRNDIIDCNKIIKKIDSDISHAKMSSRLYVFYAKARTMIPKELLNNIDDEVNKFICNGNNAEPSQ